MIADSEGHVQAFPIAKDSAFMRPGGMSHVDSKTVVIFSTVGRAWVHSRVQSYSDGISGELHAYLLTWHC